jgi:hypothetical protein
LREDAIKQKKLDKQTFSGMFDRGQICEANATAESERSFYVKAKEREKQIQKEVEALHE